MVGTEARGEPGRIARRLGLSLLAAVAVVVCCLFLAPSASAALKGTPERTPQVEGRVSAILRAGTRIYVGGSFQRAGGVPRANLAAFDARTGAITGWNPGTNGPVAALAASPDGRRIYAGGSFTRSGGQDRVRLAAFDAATGTVDGGWDPAANSTVYTLGVWGSRLYVGGAFTAIDGQPRSRLAMLDGTTGDLVQGWRAGTNGPVRKLKVHGSRLYVGGSFNTAGGRYRRNLAALGPLSGRPLAWRPNPTRPVIDFVPSRGRLYTAEGGAGGGAVAAYGVGSGKTAWKRRADGDVQAITLYGARVYVGGHFVYLDGLRRSRFASLSPAGKPDRRWRPSGNLGVWELTPDASYGRLYAGGDFSRINARAQRGFARFSP